MGKKISKEEIKNKFLHFIDRRKHTTEENLRLSGLIAIILIGVGIFLPLIGVNTSLGFVNGAKSSEETPIFQPNESVVEFSTSDFIFHQPLSDFEIFGTKIGDIQVLGINVYGLLTTPFPTFEKLNEVDSFLNSGMLAFLTDEGFVKFCTENLGDFGASIVALGRVISDIATNAGTALDQLIIVLNNLNAASTQIREVIATVEGYLNLVDNIFIVLFLLIFAMVIWMMIGRGPRYLPAVFLTIFSVLFLAIGIGTLVGNSIIASALSSATQELSSAISTLVEGVVPGGMGILNNLFSIDSMQFKVHVDLFCGAGWWLITIGLVGSTVVAYITPKLRKKKQLAEEATHAEKGDKKTKN